MKKIVFWLFIVIAVGALVYYLNSKSANLNSKDNQTTTSSTKQIPAVSTPISVSGWIFCVPRKTAADTKCVIGIEDNSNSYYALIDTNGNPVANSDYTTGSKGSIVGSLITNSDLLTNYNIAGVIQVN